VNTRPLELRSLKKGAAFVHGGWRGRDSEWARFLEPRLGEAFNAESSSSGKTTVFRVMACANNDGVWIRRAGRDSCLPAWPGGPGTSLVDIVGASLVVFFLAFAHVSVLSSWRIHQSQSAGETQLRRFLIDTFPPRWRVQFADGRMEWVIDVGWILQVMSQNSSLRIQVGEIHCSSSDLDETGWKKWQDSLAQRWRRSRNKRGAGAESAIG